MTPLRQRLAQRVGTMLIVAALLAPLAWSGHGHTNAQLGATDTCPVCIATHHSPAVATAPVIQPAPVLPVLAVVTAPVAVPVAVARPINSGRAPPFFSASAVA